jgi:hypothetical protein
VTTRVEETEIGMLEIHRINPEMTGFEIFIHNANDWPGISSGILRGGEEIQTINAHFGKMVTIPVDKKEGLMHIERSRGLCNEYKANESQSICINRAISFMDYRGILFKTLGHSC